jgi:hypothetical protein
MGCEILSHVKKIEKKSDLECQEECQKNFTCPFINNDRYFPKTKILFRNEQLELAPEEPNLEKISDAIKYLQGRLKNII